MGRAVESPKWVCERSEAALYPFALIIASASSVECTSRRGCWSEGEKQKNKRKFPHFLNFRPRQNTPATAEEVTHGGVVCGFSLFY